MIDKHVYIPGCLGYCCGSDGSIFSKRKRGRGMNFSEEWHRMKPTVGSHGYFQVKIVGMGMRTVHSLILESFIGPCPIGMEACHWDGNRLNNQLGNLRWGTPKNNAADRVRHGTIVVGSRNGSAKLVESNIETIGRLRDDGFSYAAIADLFDVSGEAIRSAHNGRSWRHVPRLSRG